MSSAWTRNSTATFRAPRGRRRSRRARSARARLRRSDDRRAGALTARPRAQAEDIPASSTGRRRNWTPPPRRRSRRDACRRSASSWSRSSTRREGEETWSQRTSSRGQFERRLPHWVVHVDPHEGRRTKLPPRPDAQRQTDTREVRAPRGVQPQALSDAQTARVWYLAGDRAEDRARRDGARDGSASRTCAERGVAALGDPRRPRRGGRVRAGGAAARRSPARSELNELGVSRLRVPA